METKGGQSAAGRPRGGNGVVVGGSESEHGFRHVRLSFCWVESRGEAPDDSRRRPLVTGRAKAIARIGEVV